MHNLHFVVVKADTAKEACKEVESEIQDFGNENNWRTICGCVSSKNKTFNYEDGRWSPTDESLNSIKKINKFISEQIKPYKDEVIQGLESGKTTFNDLKGFDWYSLEKYAKDMFQYTHLKTPEQFDVLKDTYYEHSFDEFGVTNLIENTEGKGTYVVFVDMHS